MLIFPADYKPKLPLMRKSLRFLLATVASLLSLTAISQTIISGKVKNSANEEVVPAVSVVVKGTSVGTYTNSNGEFSLSIGQFPVTLVFTSIGYDSLTVEVKNASTPLDISFKPNSQLGQEVVVSANRAPQRILESPVTVERMSAATIRNAAAPNFYEAITNLKGVDMHTASLTFRTVTTRGFVSSGNNRLNQLIDGMDNQAPGLNFSVGNVIGPNDLDVDNVELLAGASSALYGSGGINGTLLINSKNPFKYQGLSFNIKQGINHVDGRQRAAAPYYDWQLRWAKAFNDKFAFKISASLVNAQDWEANDYRNKQQIGVLSKVTGGSRENDPNFNGVNIYGDEVSANMSSFAQLVQSQIRAGILGATGNQIDVVSLLNSYYGAIGNPAYPTAAQQAGFYTFAGFPAPVLAAINNPAIQGNINNLMPFYNGNRNGYFGNYNVSRTGYNERDLVDYNAVNVKLNASLHYKITPGIEASLSTYFGTGTTVYTGADRYSLRNLKIAQHKLEIKGKSWMVRGYTTQENAGDSYNASALGAFINDSWKANATWFQQYVAAYSESRRQGGAAISDMQAHMNARAFADQGRLLPGTPEFNAASSKVKSTPIKRNGAKFLDRSDLYAGEGQLNVSDALNFSDKLEVIAGAQWKQYVMNSQGTIFADTAGVLKINEIGGYLQLKKAFFDNFLTITASGRYDKQTNFDGRFTPRVTGVFRVAKDNNIRLSYQTAYRFPTNQNQYISLVTGSGTLIGCLPEFQSFYKLNSTLPGYTAASILAYRNSGNPNNTSLLVAAEYKDVKPESVNSYELGYRGVLGGRLLIDAYVYYSRYQDFLSTVAVGQTKSGNQQELYSPFTTTNISYVQNATAVVKAIGWGISAEYKFAKNYFIYGNVFQDELNDVPAGFVSYFNAPDYRFNIGLRSEDVYKGVGFNIVAKYQGNNYYEGTFVTGTLPSFTWVDAQVSYRVPKSKSTIRIGGTNILNSYYRTGFGSPYVGGLYYVSYGFNL
jgi:outer membrane receptor protein involved in Fe transport